MLFDHKQCMQDLELITVGGNVEAECEEVEVDCGNDYTIIKAAALSKNINNHNTTKKLSVEESLIIDYQHQNGLSLMAAELQSILTKYVGKDDDKEEGENFFHKEHLELEINETVKVDIEFRTDETMDLNIADISGKTAEVVTEKSCIQKVAFSST